MYNEYGYHCDLHKEFAEGLIRFADEFPDKRPTKSALAKYLNRDPAYIKADGKIAWHDDIIQRCRIAEREFDRLKEIKNKRKKNRNKSATKRLTEENEVLEKELEEVKTERNDALKRELDLYRALMKVSKELEEIKSNSILAMSVNNDWRLPKNE